MTPRKPKSRKKDLLPRFTPRRRGQGDIEPTTPKSYTLPYYVILELRKLALDYGSQGRALQVATEITARLKRPPTVGQPDRDTLMRMTYKLPPRTIRVIDELAHTHYEDAGQVIEASLKVLKMKKID